MKTEDGSVRSAPVAFRPEIATDEPFVRRAHVAHKRTAFAGLPWPEDALERLCEQQHDLQERHISLHNSGADRLMIEVGGQVAGRLCLERTTSPWRIVDIALLPEAQGRGTGSAAIGQILQEARIAGAAVDLNVALENSRAEALYRRLGFRDAIGGTPTHRRLMWTPVHVDQLKTA